MIVKLISYNIQRGIHFDTLFSHFKSVREFQEADILAIQEACVVKGGKNTLPSLLKAFPGEYSWSYRKVMTYPDKEYGNGFIFKAAWTPIAEEVIALPQVKALKWYEKQKTEGGAPDTKSAFVQTFQKEDHFVRITNVHMDFAGGTPHRQTQLRHLLNFLDRSAVTQPLPDIICGDFNTAGRFYSPEARQNTQSVLEMALSQGYTDCSQTVDWTHDLFSSIDKEDPARYFLRLCKYLGFRFRQKMDHILARGIKSIPQIKKITLPQHARFPGSDHIPLYAEFEI
jgi:endonuclease/exonuclease/phosphatase family metal-dependent hydrolase